MGPVVDPFFFYVLGCASLHNPFKIHPPSPNSHIASLDALNFFFAPWISKKRNITYKTTPEVSCLGGSIGGQTNVLVGVDVGIASKVEPAVLQILICLVKKEEKRENDTSVIYWRATLVCREKRFQTISSSNNKQ